MSVIFKNICLIAISIIFMIPFANAECFSLNSLKNGIVVEQFSQKGSIYNIIVEYEKDYIVGTIYNSHRKDRDFTVWKSYRGLFTVKSWKLGHPNRETLHSYDPDYKVIPEVRLGTEFTYQHIWDSLKFGKFTAVHRMKVVDEAIIMINECPYKVKMIETNSMIDTPRYGLVDKFTKYLYFPELHFKSYSININNIDNLVIRKLNKQDFVPKNH